MVGKLKEAALKALQGEPTVIDIYIGPTNLPTIGFALPVYGIQDDGEGAKGIGAVVGVKIVDQDLFAKLVQPGETSETSETYLARAEGAQVEFLSPLSDGTPPLKRALAIDTPDLAAAYAVGTPGGFALKRDYTGEEVLMVVAPHCWSAVGVGTENHPGRSLGRYRYPPHHAAHRFHFDHRRRDRVGVCRLASWLFTARDPSCGKLQSFG